MIRLALILVGLLALWSAPLTVRALDVTSGGGCAADCTFTGTTTLGGPVVIDGTTTLGDLIINGTVAPLELAVSVGNLDIGAKAGAAGILFYANGGTKWELLSGGTLRPGQNGVNDLGSSGSRIKDIYTTSVVSTGLTLATLAPTANGTVIHCTDCLHGSNPCTDASTGAIAKRLNGVWVCN